MGVEGLLHEYKNMDIKLKTIEVELSLLRNNLGSLRSMTYEEKVSTSRNNTSSIENELIQKEKREEFLLREQMKLEHNKSLVENSLQILNERELEVVKLRLLKDNLSFQMIGDRLCYGKTTVARDYRKAIKKLEQVLLI